jgi:hypothetical protein
MSDMALKGNVSTLTCLRFVDECKFLDEGPGLKDIANALNKHVLDSLPVPRSS